MEKYVFKGENEYGCMIRTECGLEIMPLLDGHYTVILTELDDNPGMSVTNAYEYLATAIYKDRLKDLALPPQVRWIEHYEGREQWDEVDLKYDDAHNRFYAPRWRGLTEEEVYILNNQKAVQAELDEIADEI